MDPNTLLDHQLGQLDPARAAECESALAADPALAQRSHRLGHALRLLLDDGDGPEPPRGLADRTLRYVAESRSTLPMRPDWAPTRARFRPADLAVAATIFLAAAATMVPAVQRVREQMGVVNCARNLRDLGVVLGTFASSHGHFPYAQEDKPLCVNMAEMVSDSRRDPGMLSCPSNRGGFTLASIPPRTPIDDLLKQVPDGVRPAMEHGYAFHVGHRNGSGRPAGVRPAEGLIPLVTDPPQLIEPCGVADGNSPSHNRGGQNTLFADLHVRWLPGRKWLDDNDIYRNRDGRCSYGLDERDVAMMPLLMPMQD